MNDYIITATSRPSIGTNIGANTFEKIGWGYEVPNGYKLIGLDIQHSGSHFVLPFGTDFSGSTGWVVLYTYMRNTANYEMHDIIPSCRVVLRKL